MKSLTISLSIFFITISLSQAQFQKYKARTKLKNKSGKENSQLLVEKKDVFGRSTDHRSQSEQSKKKEKYVNLNPETAFGPEVVTDFNFTNTSLVDLTKHIQKLTGINLIWGKEVKGNVSILSPSSITVGEAWKAYLTALNVNGYTLIKTGAFYKIIQSRSARQQPTKTYTGSFTPSVENFLMKVIPIKNIKSEEIYRNLRAFVTRDGRIINIKETNTIIILDTGVNINRLSQLIKLLDVPGHEETLHIIPMKYSSAQEIASLLDTILKDSSSSRKLSRGKPSTRNNSNISKIIAEPRTNSIIALTNAQGIKELKTLIAKLDVKYGAQSADKIHVYYLNYGSAKELSQTLSTLVNNTKQSNSRRSSSRNPLTIRSRLGQNNDVLFSADIKITADEPNNALVVTASPTDWLTIEQVIKKLDIPRDQVYVEGMIMETNISRDRDVGISVIGAYGTGAGQKAGFVPNSGIVDLISNNFTNLGGLFVGGNAGKEVTLDISGRKVTVNSVTGLIRAIATDSNTNVLATPQILSLDNEEAEFEVGESIPITETSTANSVTSTSTKTQDVTLKIKIKPQINKVTRFIKLKIDQDIRDFSQRDVGTSQGVATTTRRAITTVVVRDRDTVAMGGLMRDQITDTENKVPLLGDIPILGWLFKSKKSIMAKINLLFFLTPQILSPYENVAAPMLKDALNRRAAHLKSIHGENDPFKSTAHGLYKKAKKQAQGPLYQNIEGGTFYQEQNRKDGIEGQGNKNLQEKEEDQSEYPNYQKIYEESKQEE